MVSMPVELPDNLPACHAVILRQAERSLSDSKHAVERLNRDLASLKRQLFGSRRERFEAGSGEDPAGQDAGVEASGMDGGMVEGRAWKASRPRVSCSPQPAAGPTRRTSKGRQKRVIDASIPREKVLHRLDERDVPPELWNDPRAKRFFRFVREEVELQEARVRVLEHYEEVIALEDEATGESRLVAASTPEPLIERCYVGVGVVWPTWRPAVSPITFRITGKRTFWRASVSPFTARRSGVGCGPWPASCCRWSN